VLAGWLRLRECTSSVITISQNCAATIVAEFGVPRAKVHAIHLGVNRNAFKPDAERARVPSDYLLHVSLGDLARKNIRRTLQAYALVPRALRIPFLLKIRGAPPDLDLPDGARVEDAYIPDAALAAYYRGARCLVFPSVYEGFGLPITEAMASGCPVLTSNSSACAEVAGDRALLVDPLSTASIALGLERILGDEELALDLSRRGLERAKLFDWDRCAAAHAAIFRRAAGRAAE
jgi:glycosyltransferase involved in cell wall biosynthesis